LRRTLWSITRSWANRFVATGIGSPIVLIGLGILIIYQAGSLGLLLRHGGF
jgi:cadmium resistance protein CadD (predicted permease)